MLHELNSSYVRFDIAIRETIMKVNPTGVIYCAVPKHGGAAGKGGDKVMNGIVDDVVAAAEASVIIGARFIAISTDQVRLLGLGGCT